jgi:hypothetical protein
VHRGRREGTPSTAIAPLMHHYIQSPPAPVLSREPCASATGPPRRVQVWSVRVDVTILDHCGNLVDAAMVAATTALRAFRRPDVSVSGEDVTIVCTAPALHCTAPAPYPLPPDTHTPLLALRSTRCRRRSRCHWPSTTSHWR